MPGAPDRLARRDPIRDETRPQEAHDVRAQLRERLERLPHGHPSSPYRSDGSRKPPVPSLAERELPLPGETDSTSHHGNGDPARPSLGEGRNDAGKTGEGRAGSDTAKDAVASSQDRPDVNLADQKPVVGEDGSWSWKGRHLKPDQVRIADRALARCRAAEGRKPDGTYGEHGLTPAMRRIEAELDHGRLVEGTENHALKSPDRFKEKLADRINLKPRQPPQELADKIHDGIRYTLVLEFDHYTESYWKAESIIESQGYELTARKPNWHNEDYRGLNSQWQDPKSGLLFEIQFHTRESWQAKQETHAAYEKIADTRTPGEERARLDSFQRKVTALVRIPEAATKIPPYRKEDTTL